METEDPKLATAISRILADRHLNMGVKENNFSLNLWDLAGDRRSRCLGDLIHSAYCRYG